MPSLSYKTLPGDIDHLIVDDHAIVERQFQHLEAGRGDRRILVDQISALLSLHSFAEETVLYPVWDEIGMGEAKAAAINEHQHLKELLSILSKSDSGEAAFENALTELISETRHHVRDEEELELPEFRRRVGDARMGELGRQFVSAKGNAPTSPHPSAPSEGAAEKVAGMFAAPFDMLRDKLSGKDKEVATDASGILNSEAQAIVDAHASLGPLPFETLSPEDARKQPGPDDAVKKLMGDLGLDGPEEVGSVEDVSIPDAAGGTQRLRIYTPKDAAPSAPVIVWIHGGGWVLFDIDTYDASCRGLCNKTGAIVVSPEYRRAPEAVFPAAHDDVLAAYRWVRENISSYGGDPSRIGIGGESVGGNMAPATVLQLSEAGEQLPAAIVCVYPLTTGEQFGESMDDAADGRPLNRALLSWMAMHAFEGVPDAAADRRIDLLNWNEEQLRLLPSTLVITAERDVLRSQGEEFARRLEAAGVETTYRYYPGVMHEFFGAAAVLKEAEAAQQAAAEHFLRAFSSTDVVPEISSPSAPASTPVSSSLS